MESWGGARVSRVYADGTEGNVFILIAPPNKTAPDGLTLLKGRWLRSGDKVALVLNQALSAKEPDIAAGAGIKLGIEGRRNVLARRGRRAGDDGPARGLHEQ